MFVAGFGTFSPTSGIAIGPILFVVAILAVLVGAIAAGSGGFGESGATTTARIQAQSLIAQADLLRTGTTRLLTRGCPATELSFKNDIVAGYDNSAAPADQSCDLFQPAGANQTFPLAVDGALTGTARWKITGSFCVAGNGSYEGVACWNDGLDNADLVAVIGNIRKPVCEQLQKILNNTTGIYTNAGTEGADSPNIRKFTGVFGNPSGPSASKSSVDNAPKGLSSFCYEDSNVTPGTYSFLYLLHAR